MEYHLAGSRGFDRAGTERLAATARKRMQQHKRRVVIEPRQRITGGQGKLQGARPRRAEEFREGEVAVDGMSAAVNGGDVVVEQS